MWVSNLYMNAPVHPNLAHPFSAHGGAITIGLVAQVIQPLSYGGKW